MSDNVDLKKNAQENIPLGPVPGEVYKHYKGGLYKVVAYGLREDTLVPAVMYQSVKYGYCWERTLDNWEESVVVDGKYVPRFVKADCSRLF